MFAASTFCSPLRRPRPVTLRGLVCGLVLSAGVSTLAGGGSAAGSAQARAHRQLVPPAGPAVDHRRPPAASDAVLWTSPANTLGSDGSRDGAVPARAAAAHEPPPYAPGGDDVLNLGEPAPQGSDAGGLPRSITARAAPADRGAKGMPTLTLWLDRPRVALGDSAVLQVAAGNASRCSGLGGLQALHSVGTRIVVQPTVPGRHHLAVSCAGEGGRVEQVVTLVVPLPVSTAAQQNEGLDAGSSGGLHAAGDFFQEGRQAVFVTGGSAPGAPAQVGEAAAEVQFWSRDDAGRWADRSAELLPHAADRKICSLPGQALTADFNLDGKPDVYVACRASPPASGDVAAGCCRQVLFLSQSDGLYRRVEMAFVLQAGPALAADVDGDGVMDIVSIGTLAGRPWVLLGRGDGTFSFGSTHLLPQSSPAPPQGRR